MIRVRDDLRECMYFKLLTGKKFERLSFLSPGIWARHTSVWKLMSNLPGVDQMFFITVDVRYFVCTSWERLTTVCY
jgi:hypothetical protein